MRDDEAMLLILSNQEDAHVPMVLAKLDQRGAEYLWFDPSRFPGEAQVSFGCSASGVTERLLTCGGRTYDLSKVRAVWYRRPGAPAAGADVTDPTHRQYVDQSSERFLTGVWETLECRWLPGKPTAHRLAHNKVVQLPLAARLGFLLPDTLITNAPARFIDFYADCDARLVSKSLIPMNIVRDDEDHIISYTHPVHRRQLANAQAVRHSPVIFQSYVPKSSELRVTVIGRKVFAAEIPSQESQTTRHDWRHDYDGNVPYRSYHLPAEVERRCVAMVEALGLTYGAIDLILTPDGEFVFLEINANGQWAWVEDLTGLPLADAVADFLLHGDPDGASTC
jgi:hypothetical protein